MDQVSRALRPPPKNWNVIRIFSFFRKQLELFYQGDVFCYCIFPNQGRVWHSQELSAELVKGRCIGPWKETYEY